MLKTMITAAAVTLVFSGAAVAQEATKPAANAEAMAKMAAMKGVWKGEASGVGFGGVPFKVTQTERIGPMLGGDVLVIEGRGYKDDGSIAFNAFGVLSFNAQTSKYEFRAYNGGFSGTYDWTPTDTGAIWSIPAGPNANIVSTITLTDGKWHEVQAYVVTGQEPKTVVDMTLTRVGDTDWPLAGAVTP